MIYTIGHGTRSLDELTAMLRAHGVSTLADVRTVPRSRRNPQVSAETLPAELRRRGLRYERIPELGGLRRPRPGSARSAWRNASFQGYADHMQTAEFRAGLDRLLALARGETVAILCAESVPWRCHRSLVADALTARGEAVAHILSAARAQPHRLTPFAELQGTRVVYPAERALDTPPPFHLEATVRVLQRRPTNRVDVWEDGRYLRVLPASGGLALVEVANRGTIDRPELRWSVLEGRFDAALADRLRTILGLDVDPDPLERLAGVEAAPQLRSTGRALRGMRPPRFVDLFETFANVVPFQQVSLDSGLAAVGRLVERFGETLDHAGRRFHAFPTAAAIAGAPLQRIRECGLSMRKAEVLKRLAQQIADGALDPAELASLPTPAARDALEALPGIGPWSAGLVLLRGFGRLDVFPPGDIGAARGLGALLGLPPGASLDRIVERFGDRRGFLYFFALGRSLLERGLIHPATTATPDRPVPAPPPSPAP